MICKLFLIGILNSLLYITVMAQTPTKPDLYFYFQTDTTIGNFKTHIQSDPVTRNNKIVAQRIDIDIFHYRVLSADKQYDYSLFATLEKNNFCVSDSSIFKKKKLLPYKNLEKIKGLIADEWDKKVVTFNKVFIVQKIADNQFKINEVQLYFPFSSEGVKIKSIK